MMKIIVDENIAFAKNAFKDFGDLVLISGRDFNNNIVKDADAIIIRSITKVDEYLLKKSKVKFIGTATIGTDHIDLKYLQDKKIAFVEAKGCNADSVAEYVFTALLKVSSENNISLKGKTLGVVGIGNIGSRIIRLAESIGMNVIKNDPPLERKGIGKNYVQLNEIFKADIITLHVPLSLVGIDKTFHLFDKNNLEKIKEGAIIINTSRGAVIDNSALLTETIDKNFKLVIDVWEDEPEINKELLDRTEVGTPHIAGYSFEGKVNGTKIIYDALCRFMNAKPLWKPELPYIGQNILNLPDGKSVEERLYRLFSCVYSIGDDDSSLRKISTLKQPGYFDLLRKNYPVRREFSNYTVQLFKDDLNFKPVLENFRFKVQII